jgi:2-oxoglutarate dehydrogenase E2 component (dihydrolipoamide succinyltransferase)
MVFRRLSHTTVRRAIAEHMVLSKHTSPHVTTIMEADLSRVVRHRQENKESFARDGVNLTFTAYFVAATVAALKTLPIVNSSWGEDGLHIHREINIGMATSLGEAGLIVPVICNADGLFCWGSPGLSTTWQPGPGASQTEEVKAELYHHQSRHQGSLFATPIINQPHVASWELAHPEAR